MYVNNTQFCCPKIFSFIMSYKLGSKFYWKCSFVRSSVRPFVRPANSCVVVLFFVRSVSSFCPFVIVFTGIFNARSTRLANRFKRLYSASRIHFILIIHNFSSTRTIFYGAATAAPTAPAAKDVKNIHLSFSHRKKINTNANRCGESGWARESGTFERWRVHVMII